MTKRDNKFETVSVSEALRAAMKSAGTRRDETKTEPYATRVTTKLGSVKAEPASDRDRPN